MRYVLGATLIAAMIGCGGESPQQGVEQAMAKAEIARAEQVAREESAKARIESEIASVQAELATMNEDLRDAKADVDAAFDAQQAAAASSRILERFVVTSARFEWVENFGEEPVIHVSVKNNTGQPISKFMCDGTLSSPGRSIPWVKGGIGYEIPGGLEPGESGSWSLSPNMFGDWSKAPKNRDDMVLTLTTSRLWDANDQLIETVDATAAEASLTAARNRVADIEAEIAGLHAKITALKKAQ